MGNTLKSYVEPGPYPETDGAPTFDPLYGFPHGRKERVMKATEQEMIAAKVPLRLRDYCAHHYLDYLTCQRKEFPFVNRCRHLQHTHTHCEFEDHVLRMKEYERERRLLRRQQRIEAANSVSS